MLRKVIAFGFVAGLAVAAQAQNSGQKSAKPWPAEVQRIYDGYKAQCRNGGGKFVPDKANFAQETEVTGDKKPDWIVENSAYRCEVPPNRVYAQDVPESGTSYCGTAGCTVTVLGSGRRGLTPIFEDNIRAWDAVDLPGGKKGMEISVHGSVCGGVGAEICLQTLAWNGTKWDLVKTYRYTDADYERDQRAMAEDPSMAYAEPVQHTARWLFAGERENAIAAVTDHPEMAALGMRCMAEGGLFMTVVPRDGMPLPPQGAPLLLSFTGSVDELEFTQQLLQEPGKPDFSGVLDAPLRDLLSGRDEGLMLLASADGGAEWVDLTYLSLAGSSAAIKSLVNACATATTQVAGQQSSGQSPTGPLGIVPGYYVEENEPCSRPGFEAFFYDGRRVGLMRGGAAGTMDENFVGPIGKVARESDGLFLEDWQLVVDVMSPTRIRTMHEEFGAPMRWCSAEQVPAGFRAR